VVIDPMFSPAAERADEWVPIRPGTDAYVALSMLNCLLNEYHYYDAEHLRAHTNAPYLIRPDGRYVRDDKTGKPLVWDAGAGRPKPYDDPTVQECALVGSYVVGEGLTCQPAFQCLADHVKRYAPEEVKKISTVPAKTIRRLAREFGEAAGIGSTITLDAINSHPACSWASFWSEW
jgi:molybdopterin-containing oxidoreductase family molybdopterin binding subunit